MMTRWWEVFRWKCRARHCCNGCCALAVVDAHKMRTGSLWGDDIKKIVRATEELSNARLFIDDVHSISLSEMRAKARRLKQAQGRLDLLVVDYRS
jgi:replicative DNA helicase